MTASATRKRPVRIPDASLFPIEDDPIEQRMRACGASHREILMAAQDELSEALTAAGLTFEGRAYPVSLRPLAISDKQACALASVAERLVKMLDTAAALYLEDPRVRRLFPSYEGVARYITAVPGLVPLVRVCRFDTMLAPDGQYRILETNTDCPGGVIQSALATRIWAQMANPLMDGLPLDEDAQPFVNDPDCFFQELLASHRAVTGKEPARAAVVNFKGRYTNEVMQMVKGLNRHGVDTVLRDAAELRRVPGGITDATGTRIDLTYNKSDVRDLLDEPAVTDYLAATAAGDVTYLNPLMAQWILCDKAILAVLSDAQFAASFTEADRTLIKAHVPWTRFVRAGKTSDPEGRPTDLLTYIAQHREQLVLKPSNATRGEGVAVGPVTGQEEWERHLAQAVRSVPYVVQEYVPGAIITAPHPISETIETMTAGLDVYVFGGRFAGFHARGSLDPVVNIGRRGVLLPVAVMKGVA